MRGRVAGILHGGLPTVAFALAGKADKLEDRIVMLACMSLAWRSKGKESIVWIHAEKPFLETKTSDP